MALDALATEMEAKKAAAWMHIQSCEACEQLLEDHGVFCPLGEALKALADKAIRTYVQQVLQAR